MLPTGSKYAYLYLEGKFLTIGEAAAKQDVYEPGSGRMKNNSITMPASTGQGVRMDRNGKDWDVKTVQLPLELQGE
ncbi:hypothetical protein CVT26_010664 [Gymnopilus dilepis]|uniref:Uncharacterized protein n=1 Tax=Gymnopilus dilepis TaxID=231916 RepID=A0A409VIE1_9AGAR|nr:hypothetical protein CVT26_010664 [Gymnopilus dilepis]